MKTESIYEANNNHPYLKEGTKIKVVDEQQPYIWKNGQWVLIPIINNDDREFWKIDWYCSVKVNINHWQLVKENKGDFEIGKFYKYRDGFGVLIFQIKNKIGSTYFVNLDSSLGFDDTINSFAKDSIIYRNSVEAIKEDIEYCLKQKAKEKGLFRKTKCDLYQHSCVGIKYIRGNIDEFYLKKVININVEGCAEFGFYDKNGDVLWTQNEGWLVEPEKEPEYIKTQEGEKKYKGDIVYIVKDNYEVKRVKLVDDGEGNEKINDRKVFSNWYNAMEYVMKELRVAKGIDEYFAGCDVDDKRSESNITIFKREFHNEPNNEFTVDFSDCKWNYINEWDRKEFSKNDILNLKKRIGRRVYDLEVDKQKEILDIISKLFKV